jgi:hypothetical protein
MLAMFKTSAHPTGKRAHAKAPVKRLPAKKR